MEIGIQEVEAKYEVLQKLGEGGMGSIYKVRHKLLDEIRVIKTIRGNYEGEMDLQKRFLREAQVAAKLRHPNIATIHDFSFGEDQTAYIVMDFIAGQNIREYLRSGGSLNVRQVSEVGHQTLDAIGYLHEKNFVHRDISTDNIMISFTPEGLHVTLIDLGLAKSLAEPTWKTRTGMVVGKVRYISPEQLSSGVSGADIDGRADLYSFGVVLYELLTGEFPITGDDDMSLIAGHLYRPPRPFDETDPNEAVSSPLRQAVMRALEKNVDDRWQTAGDFASALTAALNQRTTDEVIVGGGASVLKGQVGVDPNQPTATMVGVASDGDGQRTARVSVGTLLGSDPEAVTAPVSVHVPTPAKPPRSGGGVSWPWLAAIGLVVSVAVVLLGIKLAQRFSGDDPALAGAGEGGPVAAGAVDGGPEASDGTEAGAAQGESPPATPADLFFGNYHALVIGNNDYQQLPDLQTAVRDARAVADVLEKQYGFRVELLENADRQQIADRIGDLSFRLTQQDNLLIYYAGHGNIVNGTSPYWQAVDAEPDSIARWISTRFDVTDELDGSMARHVLVVADSCYAGGEQAPLVPIESVPEEPESFKRQLQRRSRLVLTSGGLSPVLDTGGGDGHSIFANAFLEVLRSNSSILQVSQLHDQVARRVSAAAARSDFEQTPVLAPMPGTNDEGGQLLFVPAETADG